jgi:hypothetical protein
MRTIFMFIALLLVVNSPFANEIDTLESFLKLGVRGGVNLSSTWGKHFDREGGEFTPSFVAGALTPLTLSKRFMLDCGLQLNLRGTSWISEGSEYELDNLHYQNRLNLYYIEIPAVMKFLLVPDGAVRPFVGVGGSFGVRFVSMWRQRPEEEMEGQSFRTDLNLNDETKPIDVSVVGTAGVHIWAWDGFFELALRGYLGLLDYDKDVALKRFYTASASIGYVFDLKRKKSLW